MRRRLIFLGITAAVAMLIVSLVNGALKAKEATIEALQHSQVQIVVAARALAAGTAIDAGSIKLAAWPRDDLPPGALSNVKQALGGVVKHDVTQNQPIVQSTLLERGSGGGVLPFLIPNGKRAMSIPVTPVSDMAGMILPHTRVDVLVTNNETGGGAERTRIVLQNIEVLAVQTTLDSAGNEPQHAEVVTLLVTPHDAERLAAAIHLGTIQLAMRNYADQQLAATSGVDARQLLGYPAQLPAQSQSVPVILPPPHFVSKPQIAIEVIRNGKERQTIDFARSRPLAANSQRVLADPLPTHFTQPSGPVD